MILFLVDYTVELLLRFGPGTTRERGVLSSVLDITSFKYHLLSKFLSKILLKRQSF